LPELLAKADYRGSNFPSGELRCKAGDKIEVSEKKAAQLLRDFPDRFEKVGKSSAAKRRKDAKKAAERPERQTTERPPRTTSK